MGDIVLPFGGGGIQSAASVSKQIIINAIRFRGRDGREGVGLREGWFIVLQDCEN